ncbi:MAG: DUF2071 domain-containing protein [Acidobacteria bacterium]|nr:DUF2071 domain-containing protein [Acidobacteriota bacterium]
MFARIAADVPKALYLNYLAPKSYAAALAPGLFEPLALTGNNDATLFTVLLFRLEGARPLWAPRSLSLAPQIMQSNWRFYGHISEPAAEPKPCVYFVRTVTTSLALALFGRRLARCFPLRRAQRMRLEWSGNEVVGSIDPGRGSAPALYYAGQRAEAPQPPSIFTRQFSSYEEYAHWIVDQHLSVVLWPREYVVQDMHLDFRAARIIPLTCRKNSVTGVDFIIKSELIDSFAVEGLKVFLDNLYRAYSSTAAAD